MKRGARFPFIMVFLGVISIIFGYFFASRMIPLFLRPRLADIGDDDAFRYVIAVSEAYQRDGRLEKASTRLACLGRIGSTDSLISMLEQMAAEGKSADELIPVSLLIADIGGEVPQQMQALLSATASPSPTDTDEGSLTADATASANTNDTPTISPSPTELAVLNGDFVFTSETFCDASQPPHVEVIVTDAGGFGLPATLFTLVTAGHVITLSTGLKPEEDPGFLDFRLFDDMMMTLTPVTFSGELMGFSFTPCETDQGVLTALSYRLSFEQIAE